MVDPTSIESLNQSANQAEDRAIALAGSSASLADKLRDAVAGRFQESPIAAQRDEALKTYITTAPNTRAELADTIRSGTILNPNQQQAIIASKQAANVVPLLSLNDLLSAQFGTMNDIIGGGVRGLEAQNQAAQAAATIARNRANTAFDQSIKERELAIKSGGSALSVLDQLIMQYILGQQGNQKQGADSSSSSQYANFAAQYAPNELARASILSNPGIGVMSLQGITQEVPVFAPEGTIIDDDETGYSYIFKNGQWIRNTIASQPQTNWFSSIFGRGQ